MSSQYNFRCGRILAILSSVVAISFISGSAFAQTDDGADEAIEEIITVGSQIRGASITDALSVSVIGAEDIEMLGIDSGDELLQFMAEQGENFFNKLMSIRTDPRHRSMSAPEPVVRGLYLTGNDYSHQDQAAAADRVTTG
jgi:hypothetical protein